jgi:hypothetical protein
MMKTAGDTLASICFHFKYGGGHSKASDVIKWRTDPRPTLGGVAVTGFCLKANLTWSSMPRTYLRNNACEVGGASKLGDECNVHVEETDNAGINKYLGT